MHTDLLSVHKKKHHSFRCHFSPHPGPLPGPPDNAAGLCPARVGPSEVLFPGRGGGALENKAKQKNP